MERGKRLGITRARVRAILLASRAAGGTVGLGNAWTRALQMAIVSGGAGADGTVQLGGDMALAKKRYGVGSGYAGYGE